MAPLIAVATAVPADAQPVTEFPLPDPPSRPQSITAGPDGALWFTAPYEDRIWRITTRGRLTRFTLPKDWGYGAYGITPGPDRALWFTGHDGITTGPDGALWFADSREYGRIGRTTTAGDVTEFRTPVDPENGNRRGYVGAITSGRDRALWFTESFGYIGRITTAGGRPRVSTPDRVPA